MCWAVSFTVVSPAKTILVVVRGVLLASKSVKIGDDVCSSHVIPLQQTAMIRLDHGSANITPVRLTSRMGGARRGKQTVLTKKNKANMTLVRDTGTMLSTTSSSTTGKSPAKRNRLGPEAAEPTDAEAKAAAKRARGCDPKSADKEPADRTEGDDYDEEMGTGDDPHRPGR